MAYKFQVGPAILSGSTTFEDAISAASVASVGAISAATLSASAGVSGATLSAVGEASAASLAVGTNKLVVNGAGVISLGGAVDETVSVSADSFYFRDSDGTLKHESLADYAALIAGDGLAASGGVLALGVDDSTIETNADALRLKDAGITLAKMAANSVDSDQYVDGSIDLVHLSANSVDSDKYVDGSIDTAHIADDQVTLAKMAGIARGKILVGDASGDPSALAAGANGKLLVADANGDPSWTTVSGDATLSAGVLTLTADSVDSDQYTDGSIDTAHIADAQVTLAKMAANSVDSDQYVDGSIDTAHIADAQVTEDKLATSVAGVGLSGGGGSALAVDLNELVAEQVASGDFFAFVDSTDNGTHKETVDDLATLFAGNGLSAASAVMALDLNELTAAAINVANDSFAIIDADASNGSRKESFVDYASAIAGGGLTALNGGLLVTGNNVMAIADSGTLAAGYNIFADLSAPATVTLPASPDVGDSITVKGKGGVSQSNYIQIDRAGSSQLIDGEESVRIESVYGAVTMVYVGSDDWRIV